jgi:hypothetical protein
VGCAEDDEDAAGDAVDDGGSAEDPGSVLAFRTRGRKLGVRRSARSDLVSDDDISWY